MPRYFLPKGFAASGVHCGIKRFSKDLALLKSDTGCKAAAVFTKNKIKAAPVIVTKEVLSRKKPIHAIVINSGNANCCTGRVGSRDAKKMVQVAAECMNLSMSNVCVASTGLIGQRLPIDSIVSAIPKAVKRLSPKGISSAAKAILTTDRKMKMETVKFNIGKKEVVISGMCKGAGMIHPNMATMLCFILTDAKVDKEGLKKALKVSVNESFNRITIDGDMSTNDTVMLLSNGQAQNSVIKKHTKEYEIFCRHLRDVCLKLAKDIVLGGEGATKFVTVSVKGAKTIKDGEIAAQGIATSLLVKTCIYGQDGNWGRVISSLGATLLSCIKQKKLELYLDKVCVFKNGMYTRPSKAHMRKIFKRKHVSIGVDLNAGNKSFSVFTCDLSKRYVEINSHYMT